MKSKIADCYDYRKLDVPKELGRWHIPDSEIEAELEALAKDHSGEEEITEEIKNGDCVRCICIKSEEESWQNRTVLLYPGRSLSGAEDAEEAVLGKKQGEEFVCQIRGKGLTLKIRQVVRIHMMKIDDGLAAELGIPGVQTVEDYYRWYHEQHDKERKEKACIRIARYWFEEMAKRSVFDIDEEEKRAWCDYKAHLMYDAMLAAGYDMKKTPEGEILTEEEALIRTSREQERYFIPYVMYLHFSEQDGFIVTEEDFVAEIEKMAAERGEKTEELMKQTDISVFREKVYQEHAYHILMADAEKYLEV